MKKGKYTEEQIIEVLKRMEAGQKARDLARELGVSGRRRRRRSHCTLCSSPRASCSM